MNAVESNELDSMHTEESLNNTSAMFALLYIVTVLHCYIVTLLHCYTFILLEIPLREWSLLDL